MSVFADPAVRREAVSPVSRSAYRRSYALIAQLILTCATLHILLIGDSRTLGVQWISRLLLINFVWSVWSWRKLTGTLLSPYVLFLLSATVFNAGLGLLEALNLSPAPVLEMFPVEIRTRSLFFVFVALVSVHLGALFGLRYHSDELGAAVDSSPLNERALRIVGLGLIAVGIVPFFIQLKGSVSTVISGGYMALYQRDIKAGGAFSAIEILADLVLSGVFFLCPASKNRPRARRAAVSLLLINAASLLFVGLRGFATMPLASLAWLWDRTIARLPRILLVVGTVIVLVGIFPFVRSTRELSAEERRGVSARSTYSELDTHPAIDAIAEMGGSIVPLAFTLELVPAHHDYELGVGYLYAVLSLVPNLFWEKHPSAVHGAPSIWLIETIDPAAARSGSGLGFSFIAEAFLNFGPFGVPLVSFLIVYGIVRLWLWAERGRNPARFAVVASLLPSLLFCARSEILGLPRQLVWYGLAPYGAYLVVRRLLEARGGHSRHEWLPERSS
jgi:uncharacterized protein YjeT (DUF2065 family)